MRRRFGRYGTDIPAEQCEEYNDAVHPIVKERLAELLRLGRNVVVDLSFSRKADRDAYKAIVDAACGRWRLIYFDVPPQVLRRRLRDRRARDDADAFPVPDELLARFLAGFETPSGEGEEIIVVSDAAP